MASVLLKSRGECDSALRIVKALRSSSPYYFWIGKEVEKRLSSGIFCSVERADIDFRTKGTCITQRKTETNGFSGFLKHSRPSGRPFSSIFAAKVRNIARSYAIARENSSGKFISEVSTPSCKNQFPGLIRYFSCSQEEENVPPKVDRQTPSLLAGKDFQFISAEASLEEGFGLLTLCRPKSLNAISEAVMAEILDALIILNEEEKIGAVVIIGEGKAFAAGADIQELKSQSFISAYMNKLLSGWDMIRSVQKPIIAAVNGYALGGGCELAMMCDIILVGEKAIFGQPEVKLGTIPGMGGTQRLIRQVGKSRAMEMILTGESFMDAEEAVRCGLASRLVPGGIDNLRKEAISIARKIAALSRPTVAMAKEAVNSANEVGLKEGLRSERVLFHATFALEDQKEGMTAFVEKRPPVFRHK